MESQRWQPGWNRSAAPKPSGRKRALPRRCVVALRLALRRLAAWAWGDRAILSTSVSAAQRHGPMSGIGPAEDLQKLGIDVKKLNSIDEIIKIEPNCNPIYKQALFIKDTSLGDPEEVSKKLIEILKNRNIEILYNHKVIKIFPQNGKLIVNNDTFKFDIIINAAGLRADEIAKKSSLKTNYSSLPFKGKYWRVNFNNTKHMPKTLLYPIPNLEYPFLGIHTVCGKTGTVQNPHGKDHSVFIAFAPVEKPKIAIAVFIENSGFGGTWAAPTASLMIEKYLKGKVKRTWLENRMLNGSLISEYVKPFSGEQFDINE